MTATQTEVSCPKCGGRMWDNRADKKNPKAPDFKCRDRSCDGVIWPPRGKQPPKEIPGKAPWEDEQEADERRFVQNAKSDAPAITHGQLVTAKMNDLQQSYDLFFRHAIDLAVNAQKVIGPDFVITLEGLSAITATLLIASKEKGLI